MKKILVPVDFSDVTPRVVAHAAEMAQVGGGELLLLHVAAPEPEFVGYEPGPDSVRKAVARELVEEHRKVHALARDLEARGIRVASRVVAGYVAERILVEADRFGADLIVMGSHGHGALHDLLVGSATENVLRKAKCPVVVIPARSISARTTA